MRRDAGGSPIPVGIWVGAPTTLGLSTASVRTELKPLRLYRIWSSVDAFFRMGGSGVTASTSDHPLKAGFGEPLLVARTTNIFLAAIVSTGTGTLYISEINADS